MTEEGASYRPDGAGAGASGSSPRGRGLVWATLAVLTYVASRLPLMTLGFGSDSDAWSVAGTAADLFGRGEYHVSRAPGHPLHEAIYALPIFLGGALTSNVLTLLFSLALLAVVERLGHALGVSRPWWAAAILAVNPLFWITSADSTDFVLGALLGTSALLAATLGSSRWSGIFLGLGMGTRLEIAVFAFPIAVLSRNRPRWATFVIAVLACTACYLQVIVTYRRSPWLFGYLYISGLDWATRARFFMVAAWAATGLVPGLMAAGVVLGGWREVTALASRKDPLLRGTLCLAGSYALVTLVHPGKPTYYVPLLPLAILALTRVAPAAWRAALLLSFLSYALIYPDVIDRVGGSASFVFRWNNGLVVKDWVARWNAKHAAAMIDQGRRSDCELMVLGYWLPVWRWSHLEAIPVATLTPGVRVDPRTNAAFLAREGVRSVHKLDRQEAAAIHRTGIRLCYGEGIDGFLQEAYGYDIRESGATEIRARDLGSVVSERFTLPTLLWCRLAEGGWRECVRSRLEDGEDETARPTARFSGGKE